MSLFSFAKFGSDRPKHSKHAQSGTRPYPSKGHGYHNSASAVTLHRPVPPPITLNGHPNEPWYPPPHQPAGMVSQNNLQVPQAFLGSPPPNQVYGAAPYQHQPPWASSSNLANPVYPSSGGKQHESKSSLHLPSMITSPMQTASASVTTLVDAWDGMLESSSGVYDRMSVKLDTVITCMDGEQFSENESNLELGIQTIPTNSSRSSKQSLTSTSSKSNHFSKVWEYSNSRLPPYLPPVKLYLDTWPLLSLAARYSLSVYQKPKGREKNDHVKGNHSHGTKAMVLKSLPIDDRNTIVFAIRGTSTFMDWTVNMKQEPVSPAGFLDDADNFCHAGFLQVAKAMIRPVAERLRFLLQEDPSRGLASLLITGHSAGGAVAQLLYAHMTSEFARSELTHLAGFVKRVHCVTFGAPPVSLFPLQHPSNRQYKKSIFFAFANEGDPVVRADKAIVKSLVKLYAVPAPSDPCKIVCPIVNAVAPGFVPPRIKKKKSSHHLKASSWSGTDKTEVTAYPPWKVPASTLSLGGRIVLMRPRYGGSGPEDLELCSVTDEMLRDVIYGDPVAHTMTLYSRRVELLATKAATGEGYG